MCVHCSAFNPVLDVHTIPVALEWALWNGKVDSQSSHWTELHTGMGKFQCRSHDCSGIPALVSIAGLKYCCNIVNRVLYSP
ncbi:unnamed protein product, partial [Brenthis ino]